AHAHLSPRDPRLDRPPRRPDLAAATYLPARRRAAPVLSDLPVRQLAWVLEKSISGKPWHLGVIQGRLAWCSVVFALRFYGKRDAEAFLAALGNEPFDTRGALNGTERVVEIA